MLSYLNRVFPILSICTIFSIACVGQSRQDFSFLKNVTAHKKESTVSSEFATNLKNNGSEIQVVTTSLFYIYKEFFSSQDFNNCSFHPSCSVYSIECLKMHGVLKGGVMTMDRLTRCHGFSASRYEKDYSRKLLIDKVPNE